MSETAAPAIEYRDVTKTYDGVAAVDHVSATIPRGAFVCVVGTSGSGKTTVLKMANGLVRPTSGTVLVNGEDIARADLVELRRHIGYAIQGSALFPHLTVAENIAYVPNLLHKRDRAQTDAAVRRQLALVGLGEELLERYPSELSGGQQQRVGIARALAASPDILLMDEPFGAVDAITREQLQDEIARIWRACGLTVLFVTHDIEEALKLATCVLVMHEGRIEQYAAPAELLAHPATPFVERLVERERRRCFMPEDKLGSCPWNIQV